MATLYLDHVNRSLPCMGDWLQGAWGVLFSHPVDFDDHSLERDRWLEILRSEFGASGVKPIACRGGGGGEPDRGWVTAVTSDERRVRLTRQEIIDIPARRLRDALGDVAGKRFVLVVDGSLRRRMIWSYQTPPVAISPLDVLSLINVMRRAAATNDGYRHDKAA